MGLRVKPEDDEKVKRDRLPRCARKDEFLSLRDLQVAAVSVGLDCRVVSLLAMTKRADAMTHSRHCERSAAVSSLGLSRYSR